MTAVAGEKAMMERRAETMILVENVLLCRLVIIEIPHLTTVVLLREVAGVLVVIR